MFTLTKQSSNTKARRGIIQTAHGEIQTPFFMPVGTTGTLKCLTFEDLSEAAAQIMLSNTYHLYLRPGLDILKEAGGLHKFIGWDKPMLTDSGGYQVFSLAKLRKLSDDGVEFRSHLDGSPVYFTPERVMEIEGVFGSDMIMPLDECAPYPCEYDHAKQAMERTTRWAQRSKKYFEENLNKEHKQFLFGIVQGSTYQDLREQSAREITDIDFDAYAIGGVSVGEKVKDMFNAIDWVVPMLPENKPRYLMGIGLPDQMVKAVGEGIDMFDTVLPTRMGRHFTAFTSTGRKLLRNAEFTRDEGSLDPQCGCVVCKNYTLRYLRHLSNLNEMSAMRMISYHNLYFYVNLMKQIREAIDADTYDVFQRKFLESYKSELLESV